MHCAWVWRKGLHRSELISEEDSISPLQYSSIAVLRQTLIVRQTICEWISEKGSFCTQDRFRISDTGTKHSGWPLCCILLRFNSCSNSGDMLAWSMQIHSVWLWENGSKHFTSVAPSILHTYYQYYRRKMADELLWLLQCGVCHRHCRFQDLFRRQWDDLATT